MPTNDKKVLIYSKRLLSLTAIKDNFLDFLTDEIDEVTSAIFQGTSGVLDSDLIGLVAGATNDKFTLDLTNATKVVVGGGQIIDLSQITGTGITSDIPFEDDGSSDYYVGIKFAEVEFGMEVNPRTGDPEYASLKQTYGEVDTPDNVADNTTYIRVRINSITESGVDHSGRTVRVWLVDPVSGVESTAFFEGTSAYSSPNNYVDIPYSGGDGPLGQDTTSNPPSTTAADYKVFIEGASWKKNTDLRTDSDYAFIGIITSTGGVPTFSTADQNQIFINTLDRAYDGATGGGSGRTINVDSGSVKLRSPSGSTTTGDDHNAQLQLDKLDSTDWFQIMYETLGGDTSTIPIACLEPLSNLAGDLQTSEAADQSGTRTVDFTRGGVDLTDTSLRISNRLHFLLLTGAPTGENGLYMINSFTATSVDVSDLQTGAAPSSWTTGSGRTARIMTPRFWVGGATPDPSGQMDLLEGITIVGRQGYELNRVRFVILPEGNADKPIIYYDNADPDGTTDLPREAHYYEPNNVGADDLEVFANLRPTLLSAGDTSSAKMPAFHTKSAVTLKGGDSDGQNLAEPGMAAKVKDDNDIYMGGLSSQARFYRGHELHEDFIWHPNRITAATDIPPHFEFTNVVGAGQPLALQGNPAGQDRGHGSFAIETGGNINDRCDLRTPHFMNTKALSGAGVWGFNWLIDFKFKMINVADVVAKIGLYQADHGALNMMYLYLEFDSSTDTYWNIYWGNDDGTVGNVTTSIVPTADRWYWFRTRQSGTRYWLWSLGSRADTPEEGFEDVGPATGGGAETNFENNPGVWQWYADVETLAAAPREIIMDHLHIQDLGMPMQNALLGNED